MEQPPTFLPLNAAAPPPPFVCPLCHGPLARAAQAYSCDPCGRSYPVLCGIPDFRVRPDRYISIEDDRRKGLALCEQSGGRSFAEMLDLYWALTPEAPADLARKFTAHFLAETAMAEALLAGLGESLPGGSLVDVGCQTGGLLVAAARRFAAVIGVDVAFRWLVIGAVRLREAGVAAPLVCANAEHLPWAADSFSALTAIDLLEHLADPVPALAECRRVTARGGACYFSTNNRYSLLREPHVNVWGVGWLPRALQASYAQLVAGRSYRNIALLSAREMARAARAAGFGGCRPAPASLYASGRPARLCRAYNRMRRRPGISTLLGWIGPRLELLCRK